MHRQTERHRTFVVIVALVSGLCVFHSVGQSAPPESTDATAAAAVPDKRSSEMPVTDLNVIQGWINQLGSEMYSERQQAFMSLWQHPTEAQPLVRNATTSSDPQIATSATTLDLLFRFGVEPTDNEELAELVQILRASPQQALLRLTERGSWRIAAELIRSNEQLRNPQATPIKPDLLCYFVQAAHTQGDARRAWPVVQLLLPSLQRHWIAKQTDLKLDAPLVPENEDDRASALIVEGKFQEAWDQNPSHNLLRRIVCLSGDWKKLQDERLSGTLIKGDGKVTIESLARKAAISYLCQAREQSDQEIASLFEHQDWKEKLGAEGPAVFKATSLVDLTDRALLLALAICGQGDAVQQVIGKQNATFNMTYHTSRLDSERILQAYELENDLSNFDLWMEQKLTESRSAIKQDPDDAFVSFSRMIELSKLLVTLGEVERGTNFFRRLLDLMPDANAARSSITTRYWRMIGYTARNSQMRPHVIRILEKRDGEYSTTVRRELLSFLYPDWSYSSSPAGTANALWTAAPVELFRYHDTAESIVEQPGATKPRESRWHLLERLWQYDRTLITENGNGAILQGWLQNTTNLLAQDPSENGFGASQIAEIAHHLGLNELALSMATSTRFTNSSNLSVAAMACQDLNQMKTAVDWWEQAIASGPQRHDWIVEQMECLQTIGREDQAAYLESTRWLRPLGTTSRGVGYVTFAELLNDDGRTQEAKLYAQAAHLLGIPNDDRMPSFVQTISTVMEESKDFRQWANVSREFNLSLLEKMNTGDLSMLLHFIGKEFIASAHMALEDKDLPRALDCIKRFESLHPVGIDVCELLYEPLVANGAREEADALVKRMADRLLAHLERWPNDAGVHNNLAWLLARCDQRLEEALEHAEASVKLSRGSPTYVDTLAESHFRLGHNMEALEYAQKCVQIDPRHYHYQRQVERFQAALTQSK